MRTEAWFEERERECAALEDRYPELRRPVYGDWGPMGRLALLLPTVLQDVADEWLAAPWDWPDKTRGWSLLEELDGQQDMVRVVRTGEPLRVSVVESYTSTFYTPERSGDRV